jgi:hypothetical protein
MALRDFLIAPREAGGDGAPAGDRAPAAPRFHLPRRAAHGDAAEIAPSLGVLSAGRDVHPLAVAAGLVVARRHPAAVVCVHAPGMDPLAPALRAPARPAAARLAASLRARGLEADARGKVALVHLGRGDAEPTAAAAGAIGAAGPLPIVLAVAARDPDVDVLLATQDAILVALPPSAEPALVELATASARALTPNVATITLSLDPASRALALAGMRAPASLRDAVLSVLT